MKVIVHSQSPLYKFLGSLYEPERRSEAARLSAFAREYTSCLLMVGKKKNGFILVHRFRTRSVTMPSQSFGMWKRESKKLIRYKAQAQAKPTRHVP
jgi:hypothetical protein